MRNYTQFMKWAVAFKIDGKNYDDGKDRTSITAFFSRRENAQDFIDKCLPVETKDRFFIIYADEL